MLNPAIINNECAAKKRAEGSVNDPGNERIIAKPITPHATTKIPNDKNIFSFILFSPYRRGVRLLFDLTRTKANTFFV